MHHGVTPAVWSAASFRAADSRAALMSSSIPIRSGKPAELRVHYVRSRILSRSSNQYSRGSETPRSLLGEIHTLAEKRGTEKQEPVGTHAADQMITGSSRYFAGASSAWFLPFCSPPRCE